MYVCMYVSKYIYRYLCNIIGKEREEERRGEKWYKYSSYVDRSRM